jgi:hypothetical protein
MKTQRLFILLALFVATSLTWNPFAYADNDRIELNDGSVIQGDIVSFSEGVYTIRSATLGTITIEKYKIRTINVNPSGSSKDQSASQDNTSMQKRAKALQESMAENPDIMKSINSLQNDPDFQQVLSDPKLMEAIKSGDISKLINSPKFMKLVDKQSIQEISNKLAP